MGGEAEVWGEAGWEPVDPSRSTTDRIEEDTIVLESRDLHPWVLAQDLGDAVLLLRVLRLEAL